MQAVARGSSEEVLHLADKLISEGHSPTHFARQLVRFLRNATVAKIAGKDSSLLQISGDERERVARIAELFSEEDLARHLQIMLRTHAELGYRQEQRFHLELGLLKMSHAERLLPIEQLLSEAGLPAAAPSKPAPGRPSLVAENRNPTTSAQSRSVVSPFAADSARKSGSKPELSADGIPASAARSTTPVIMGSAAPSATNQATPQTAAPEPAPPQLAVPQPAAESEIVAVVERKPAANLDGLRSAVLNALAEAGHRMLVSMLEIGEWAVEGNEVVIKVSASAMVIDMSLGADAKRLAIATASGAMGKAMKLKVLPGGTAQAPAPRAQASSNGGRGRAEQDPIVRRMQEKFGAEIRTIIDQRDKK
jgi:DNA polymerase-3 subunit gamma/tau